MQMKLRFFRFVLGYAAEISFPLFAVEKPKFHGLKAVSAYLYLLATASEGIKTLFKKRKKVKTVFVFLAYSGNVIFRLANGIKSETPQFN